MTNLATVMSPTSVASPVGRSGGPEDQGAGSERATPTWRVHRSRRRLNVSPPVALSLRSRVGRSVNGIIEWMTSATFVDPTYRVGCSIWSRTRFCWHGFGMFHHPAWAVATCCMANQPRGTPQIQLNPTQAHDQMGHPVTCPHVHLLAFNLFLAKPTFSLQCGRHL